MPDAVGQAVRWAGNAWRREVRHVRALQGGWTSTMLLLSDGVGERAVLRLMTKDPWRRHAAGLLARQSEVQRQLSATAVPVPGSIAVDLEGVESAVTAHLMTWLPGSLDLIRDDERFLGDLAALLTTVQGVDPGGERPREYQSWAGPAKRVEPSWTRRPGLWREAFAILEQPPPAYRGRFLHRDFHVGNVLWVGGEVSGVVDWVETSWGPAALDVAHCMTNLAMLHGVACAGRFADSYEAALDGRGDGDPTYWRVMDVVGFLPGPEKVVQPWRDVGSDITAARAEQRLEDYLETVLGSASS